MSKIKTFNQFNEGILSDLSSKIGSLGKSLKRTFGFSSDLKTEYKKELRKYELSTDKSDDGQSLEIYHNKRLVGKIELSEESKTFPIWILKFFFYESEITKDRNYKRPEEIPGQTEQPYAIGKKKFPNDSDDAVRGFWKWWSTNTKSGKLKNIDYKIKD
jgi:hypothetical protein